MPNASFDSGVNASVGTTVAVDVGDGDGVAVAVLVDVGVGIAVGDGEGVQVAVMRGILFWTTAVGVGEGLREVTMPHRQHSTNAIMPVPKSTLWRLTDSIITRKKAK